VGHQVLSLQEAVQQLANGVADCHDSPSILAISIKPTSINDFKAIIGKTPSDYATELRAVNKRVQSTG